MIVGQETDGTVTPLDLGLDWLVSGSKEFVGRRSLRRPDATRTGRKQLVGLLPDRPRARAGRGRAAHGRRRGRAAGADARPRHVELPQRGARPLVRAGPAGGRPRAPRRDRARPPPAATCRPRRWSTPCSTTRRARGAMATDARRSPLATHAGRMADASGDDVRLRGVPGLAQTGLRVAPDGEAADARRRPRSASPLPVEPCTVATAGRAARAVARPRRVARGRPARQRGGDAAGAARGRGRRGLGGRPEREPRGRRGRRRRRPATCSRRAARSTCTRAPSAPDRVAGTLLGTAQAFVEQTTDEPCFRIHVRPSFLAYAVDWLVAGVEGVRAEACRALGRPPSVLEDARDQL